ncbi:MAG: hypothetical protein NTW99_07575, partial [Chloroflexi bacterium]|nr:hypothetical protein [Chloroflexota bacterium]
AVDSNISQAQDPRTFTLSGYPAASGVISSPNSDTGTLFIAYIITVLRNDEVILFMGACPQTEWTQHQVTFDSILNSAIIVQP